MSKPEKPLTPKQEAFAVAYVMTANPAEAYRRAYDVEPNATDGWIYVEAYQLLEHPRIAPRIAELHEKAKKANEFTVTKALEEYEEAREIAKSEKQAAAAVSATTAKVKLLGMDRASKVALTKPDGSELDPADVSLTEIARRMAFVLQKAANEDGS